MTTQSNSRWIDLRSDTVTQPTEAMRQAMFTADVGDDVWGEDPTVIRLQQVLAERAGLEAGLFLPSGTQSNLVALLTHCGRGDEYIVGQQAHTYRYEGGGAAALGGIQPQPLPMTEFGGLDLHDVEKAIKPDDCHFARTRLLCLENTVHGKVLPLDYLAQASEVAQEYGLQRHLDGARIFNAVMALGCKLTDISQHFDTVSICLSKGLGAPVGSVLLGPVDFIEQARRWRKVTGGGMRQAGILAAAGLHALDHHVERLADDHRRARLLAERLQAAGYSVATPQTNILFVDSSELPRTALAQWLDRHGIKADCLGRDNIRLVTHLDVSDADIDRAAEVFTEFLREHRL
ncbi:low-specificity L-threonine aldolase [Pseudohongiella sp. SYSU M77423]|uniref:low-specificity L-threonine aldolase n=1 Tax=unclassified Pseudohongiella TaxID=2629611 RepID=UPI001EFFA8AA|nr:MULTISPECIES: low-specificity L-threonine aldolase [unclassified Pseudohongiella]MDH7942319.1 low-specificity L-threonine aldolase [Pseudohongiella sp. SYSU M77423]